MDRAMWFSLLALSLVAALINVVDSTPIREQSDDRVERIVRGKLSRVQAPLDEDDHYDIYEQLRLRQRHHGRRPRLGHGQRLPVFAPNDDIAHRRVSGFAPANVYRRYRKLPPGVDHGNENAMISERKMEEEALEKPTRRLRSVKTHDRCALDELAKRLVKLNRLTTNAKSRSSEEKEVREMLKSQMTFDKQADEQE